MPPSRDPEPARPRPSRRPSGWVVAVTDLYLGGEPGTGALPQLAHRAGERLPAAAAEANGWADLSDPKPPRRDDLRCLLLHRSAAESRLPWRCGPGYLRTGPLDAVEPTNLVDTWESFDPRWILLGYTETGSEFNYALATGEVVVAEELDPVFVSTTGRTASVVFNMAELTASHLTLAMNGSPLDIDTSDPAHVIVEPPDLGREQRYMFGFESEDHSERWIYRQCFQSGTLKIARAKGNTVATIAATFSLEKPSTGKRLFAAIIEPGPARRVDGHGAPVAADRLRGHPTDGGGRGRHGSHAGRGELRRRDRRHVRRHRRARREHRGGLRHIDHL